MSKNKHIEGRYINPFIDWSFKRIFGTEDVKDILIGFLNAVFEGEHVITDIQYLNNENPRESNDGKTVIYDLYCQTDKGEYIIVEMQNKDNGNFKDRTLYYISRCIAEQGKQGDWKYELKAVYGIYFQNFCLEPTDKNSTNYYAEVALVDIKTGHIFNPKFRQFYIQLPRFKKKEEECVTALDQWIYILKNMENMTTLPFIDRQAVFARLDEQASRLNMSEEERRSYESDLKHYRDYFSTLDFAKESGARERDLAHAAAMKADGMSVELIHKYTGLSIEDIESL